MTTRQVAGFLVGVSIIAGAACSSSSSSSSKSSTAAASTTGAPTTMPSSASTKSPTTVAICASPPTTTKGGGTAPGDAAPPGDIPDNQAYVAFTPASGKYTISVPEGWARTDTADAVSFTDKLNTVRVELVNAPTAPTLESARSTEVPAIASSAACHNAGKVETVTRRVGSGILITYTADAPPDPVTGRTVRDDVQRYEFWKSGTEAVITLSGPVGADNVDPWRKITDSFTWH